VTRKRVLISVGAAAGAAVAVFWLIQKRHEIAKRLPDWGDPQQPVDGTAGQLTTGIPATPSPAASWCAVRPGTPHMLAGSTIKRIYASTLVDDPESLVR